MYSPNFSSGGNVYSSETRLCCPMCEKLLGKKDTKYHLYVNHSKGVYNCFRCGWGGNLNPSGIAEMKLLTENAIQESTEFDEMEAKIGRLFSVIDTNEFNLDQISWPITEELCPYAFAYLKERGIDEEQIIKHKLRVGKTYSNGFHEVKKWVGRILFPYHNTSGICSYIVGRSYVGKEPKYLNCKENKEYVVFGIDRLKMNETAILCEGVISSMAVEKATGKTALACLGKLVTNSQLSLIRSRTDSIIVSLDGDVDRRQRDKLNSQLLKLGFDVEEVMLPQDKDPDDLKGDYLKFYEKRKGICLI